MDIIKRALMNFDLKFYVVPIYSVEYSQEDCQYIGIQYRGLQRLSSPMALLLHYFGLTP